MKKALTVAVILTLSAVAHAGDVNAGKAKSVTCQACHGKDGISTNPMYPNLKGQHAKYLVKQLKSFKDGSRVDPIMKGMSAALSDADMENLAAYYEGL